MPLKISAIRVWRSRAVCVPEWPHFQSTQRALIHQATNRVFLPVSNTRGRQDRVLQALPLSVLVQTLSVLAVASLPSPILSSIIRFVRRHSRTISSSPILSWPLRHTFYNTFCIGEEQSEIRANIASLRSRGLSGVVLSIAREAKLGDALGEARLQADDPQLKEWVASNLETVSQVGVGDYVAIKLTGAGVAAVKALQNFRASDPSFPRHTPNKMQENPEIDILKAAFFGICAYGREKGVKIMVDAESTHHQSAIDHLTLEAMSIFNVHGSAVVSNTYQMYLRSGLQKLKTHLQHASANGYTAGIKLVRGAYLYVEPNRDSVIFEDKSSTDASFDEAVELLLCGSEVEDPPNVTTEIMIASHNTRSVDKALSLYRSNQCNTQTEGQVKRLVFAQLMGMADEVSMRLAKGIGRPDVASNDALATDTLLHQHSTQHFGVCKYTVWGSFGDCLLYMLRRAEENQDAVARSRETALHIVNELKHRIVPW